MEGQLAFSNQDKCLTNSIPKHVKDRKNLAALILPCCSDTVRNSSQPRILYTCSAQDEPDHETACHALDLAHRWQVEAVVQMLTDLLAGAISWVFFEVYLGSASLQKFRTSPGPGQVHLPFTLMQLLRSDHGRELYSHCGTCCAQGGAMQQELAPHNLSKVDAKHVHLSGTHCRTPDSVPLCRPSGRIGIPVL